MGIQKHMGVGGEVPPAARPTPTHAAATKSALHRTPLPPARRTASMSPSLTGFMLDRRGFLARPTLPSCRDAEHWRIPTTLRRCVTCPLLRRRQYNALLLLHLAGEGRFGCAAGVHRTMWPPTRHGLRRSACTSKPHATPLPAWSESCEDSCMSARKQRERVGNGRRNAHVSEEKSPS